MTHCSMKSQGMSSVRPPWTKNGPIHRGTPFRCRSAHSLPLFVRASALHQPFYGTACRERLDLRREEVKSGFSLRRGTMPMGGNNLRFVRAGKALGEARVVDCRCRNAPCLKNGRTAASLTAPAPGLATKGRMGLLACAGQNPQGLFLKGCRAP
jgi:hypothetical protein